MAAPVEAFVEHLALWFEQTGVPRMAGRVLAWLLVCDPAHQSAEELVTALHASRGSISATTRALVTAELVERVTFRGDRRIYYRARPNWNTLLEAQYKRITELRAIVDEGLDAMSDAPESRRARLLSVNDFATFWQDELARLLSSRSGVEEKAHP